MSAHRYRQRVYENYLNNLSTELEIAAVGDLSRYYEHFDRQYAPLLPADRAARVLDLGCGWGIFLSYLKARGYTAAAGVDASPQMAELAKAKGLAVERGDMIERLKAQPGAFDCVTAFDVLEHLDKNELLDLMDAVHAALKPGGTFLCHTVNADGIAWGRMRYIDLTHEMAFTRYSLFQLFSVAGFSRSDFHAVTPSGRGPRVWLRRLGLRLVKAAVGLLHHLESGSGIFKNDHIVTSSLLARAIK